MCGGEASGFGYDPSRAATPFPGPGGAGVCFAAPRTTKRRTSFRCCRARPGRRRILTPRSRWSATGARTASGAWSGSSPRRPTGLRGADPLPRASANEARRRILFRCGTPANLGSFRVPPGLGPHNLPAAPIAVEPPIIPDFPMRKHMQGKPTAVPADATDGRRSSLSERGTADGPGAGGAGYPGTDCSPPGAGSAPTRAA